jgi:hypothetical protein
MRHLTPSDYSKKRVVSREIFQRFLEIFGPLESCVSNVIGISFFLIYEGEKIVGCRVP